MTRTVTVALKAINTQFDQAYRTSAVRAKELGKETKLTAEKARQASGELGRTSALLGGALLAGFALAERAAMGFNAQMSQVKTLSHASAGEMSQLREAALTMGQAIGFSAMQTADAETELIKAGIGVSDIMGGALQGSLQLAAAGQIDVANATEIAAIAMTQFKLKGADIPHIADLLAAGADKALGSVGDLGEALKSGGLVAKQFGMSVDDTIGTLSAFAQAGLMGESAGTDLRQMLLKLSAPSATATGTMKQLGISIYDTAGHFVGITNLAGQLQAKLGKLSEAQRNEALANIFGARAIVGANILYQNGAKGVQGWIDRVNDSGFAARQAAGKMDNLKGDLSKLGAAFQADLIDSGTTADGVLRGVTQTATGAVKAFGALPKPLQAAGMGFTGIGGAALLTGGALLMTIPKIAATDAALKAMTGGAWGAKRAFGALGKAGLAVGVVAAGIEGVDMLASKLAGAAPSVDRLSASLLEMQHSGQAAGDIAKIFGGDFADLAHQVRVAGESKWFSGWQDGLVAVDKARGQINSLDQALADLVTSGHADAASRAFADIQNGLAVSGVSQSKIDSTFHRYNAALDSVAVQAGVTGTAVAGSNVPIRDQAAAAKAASDALKGELDTLKALTDPVFAMQSALAGQVTAQKAYTDAVKKSGVGSQDAQTALFGVAKAAVDVTSAAKTLQNGVEAGTTSVADMSAQLDDWVAQGLVTRGEAARLATQVGGLTSKANTLSKTPATVRVSTSGVPKTLHDLSAVDAAKRRAAAAISVPIQVTGLASFYQTLATAHSAATASTAAPGLPSNVLLPGVTPVKKAAGGWISGPGSGTSDSVPIRASRGEFVVRASQAQKHAGVLQAINGGVAGYAHGGLVGPWPATTMSSGDGSLHREVARLGAAVDKLAAQRPPMSFVIPTTPHASAGELVNEAVFAARTGRL